MEYAVVSIGLYLEKRFLTFPRDYTQLNKTILDRNEGKCTSRCQEVDFWLQSSNNHNNHLKQLVQKFNFKALNINFVPNQK